MNMFACFGYLSCNEALSYAFRFLRSMIRREAALPGVRLRKEGFSSSSGIAAQNFTAKEVDSNGGEQDDIPATLDPSMPLLSRSEFRSARIESMIASKGEFDTELEFQTAHSKLHWSELSRDSGASSSAVFVSDHRQTFEEIQKDPLWGHFCSKILEVVVGKKLGEGAQAEIFEAEVTFRKNDDWANKYEYVVKVMKGGSSLKDLQTQWPLGMASVKSSYNVQLHGALVKDRDTHQNRFGFVMTREWGDLRTLIDLRMARNRGTGPRFGVFQARWMMYCIVLSMLALYRHGILHRDIKASNVLVHKRDESELLSSTDCEISVRVADWECSMGVVGSGFWRAPEILKQLKDGIPSFDVQFSEKADVYSFGMTCYEIVTGFIPFARGHPCLGMRDAVIDGTRPELPHALDPVLKEIITSCWISNPLLRPSFAQLLSVFTQDLRNRF